MTAKMIIRDVHKAFGAKKVLSGVSLDIAAKESSGGHWTLRHWQVGFD